MKKVVVFVLVLFLLITGCSNSKETKLSNIKNVSIKASLESMHGDFDLQYRYLNKRRGC